MNTKPTETTLSAKDTVEEEDIILDDEDGDAVVFQEYEDDYLDPEGALNLDDEEAAVARIGKPPRASRLGYLLRIAVLLISALIFCYSAYMLIDIMAEYNKDAKTNRKIDSIIVDSTTSVDVTFPDGSTVTIPFRYDHEKLKNMNQEGLGYIYIPSINKRLPIVQTDNNSYYLRRAVDHTFSMAGSVFVDSRITDGIESSHIMLHGHNRQDGTMFAQLESYLKESFYKKSGNDVFYLYIDDKLMQYKIFSVYISEPISTTYAFNFLSEHTLRTYAATMRDKSKYDTNVDISEATQVVTLSTCTDDTENRIIVHGVLTNVGTIQ